MPDGNFSWSARLTHANVTSNRCFDLAVSIDFMLMRAVAFLTFHGLRLRRFHPMLLFMAGGMLFVSVLLASAIVIQSRTVAAAHASLASQVQSATTPVTSSGVKPIDLPSFDATTLIGAIERESISRQVGSDTFVFAVDDTAGLPYRRYRVSMEMVGRYPQIRGALAGVLHAVPFSALDTLKCMRDDIGETDVRCTVAMSAFYRRVPS